MAALLITGGDVLSADLFGPTRDRHLTQLMKMTWPEILVAAVLAVAADLLVHGGEIPLRATRH